MCVILIKDKNIKSLNFDKDELYAHYFNKYNYDGAGVCCINSNKELFIKKWPKTKDFESIWSEIDRLQNNQNSEIIIVHFRLGTGGGTGLAQSHPHEIFKNKLYILHNGTFSDYPAKTDFSDTQQVALMIKELCERNSIYDINSLNKDFLKQIWDELKFDSSDNRMIMLGNNDYLIFNPLNASRVGYWYKDGIWRCGELDQPAIKYEKDLNNKYKYI